MVEIYNYDIGAHERFAKDQEQVEAFTKKYQLPPSRAGTVVAQTKILDFIPKHSAIVLLMQTYQRKTWAKFTIPKNFHIQRMLSSYIAPSLGSYERQDADIHKIEAFLRSKTGRVAPTRDKEEETKKQKRDDEALLEEGETIIELLDLGVKKINKEIDYVISRIHQFVQA